MSDRTGNLLEKAIGIALRAHGGQTDKSGAPYILHPLRVMMQTEGGHARMAAVLHDVVEDSALTRHDLKQAGMPDPVLDALEALTHLPGEPYQAYIGRILENPLACRVKRADLEDNMDIRRLGASPSDRDLERLRRYRTAWGRVRAALENSDESSPNAAGPSPDPAAPDPRAPDPREAP